MIDFGKTLREAREKKGYSISQLSEATHILPQIIENLENEDFSRIVAPIYGRGFVKLYCETVGLDAKPLINEFMDIYNGNRPPMIRMKPCATVNEPPPPPPAPIAMPEPKPTPAPMPEPAPAPMPKPESAPMPEPIPEPIAMPEMEPPPIQEPPFLEPPFNDPIVQAAEPPRRDYRLPGHFKNEVPRSFWRFGLLIAAMLVILAVAFFAVRAVYRATMTPPDEPQVEKTVQPHESPVPTAPKPSEPQAPRKPMDIPPLYID